MRKEVRLMEMRREMGCAQYYAWRLGCKLHGWQKQFEYGTKLGAISERIESLIGGLAYALADLVSGKRKKGLKTAITRTLAVLMAITCIATIAACAGTPKTETYARLMRVTSVDEEAREVQMITTAGFTYTVIFEDLDVSVGDCYSCLMSDMGTPQIADDQILSVRYERVDLLEVER